ncbi:MAG: ribonuclease III [Erysipelotrichaceae bacterium]|nr:ribonuclease III [Erysipelotrichaceae bacterium]
MKTIFEWLDTMNIHMQDPNLIMEALTHSSYVNEHREVFADNERLEFMGDAVLQVWTTKRLFQLDPILSEGQMTTLRAQLVCEGALANYNRLLGLSSFLLLGVGEEKTGGRERDSILADMFEAVLGAVFLDQGMQGVDKILEKVITPEKMRLENTIVMDYKTKLQEVIQSDTRKTVHYKVINIEGPSNKPHFDVAVLLDNIVLGYGSGNSKKKAEQMAAKNAFEKMAK